MTDELKAKLKKTLTLALLAAGAALAVKLGEASLILSFGIRGAAILSKLVVIAFGAGAALSGIGALKTAASDFAENRRLEANLRKSLEEKATVEEEYAHDAGNPIITRKKLLQIKETTPGVRHLMDMCISQLDRMDELQERQATLLETNDASYLRDTVNTLNQVEQEICLNFRGIVNQCIVSGENANESTLDMKKVNQAIGRNASLLDQSKELLKVSADWIDKYNEQKDPDRSLLDSWIRTIKDTIRYGENE